MLQKVKAELYIIGVNPYILLPERILKRIFKQAGKDKGPIKVKGTVNGQPFTQTLVRYKGEWRLYINTTMLKNSPRRIGEILDISVEFDPDERTIEQHPKLVKALRQSREAKAVFDQLRPSLQLEIVRYISRLKSEESIDRNVSRAIDFLLGKARFIGRDRP